jgi:hypothetical protein
MNIGACWKLKYICFAVCLIFLGSMKAAAAGDAGTTTNIRPANSDSGSPESLSEISRLKQQLSEQQKQLSEQQRQIDELRLIVLEQGKLKGNVSSAADIRFQSASSTSSGARVLGELASTTPIIPPAKAEASQAASLQPKDTVSVQDLSEKTDGVIKSLNGFRFGGDFRLRYDGTFRSANSVAGPAQNSRVRYRLRFNVDKDIGSMFAARFQLASGPLNNGLTNDQDFNATILKDPISIAEVYLDFHPDKHFSVRGGRMEEAFADNTRFIWDDDVRFNGFSATLPFPISKNALGLKSFEIRSGVYFLASPNVQILAESSPYVSAGYIPGQKIRDAMLYHPGFVLKGDVGSKWDHTLTADIQLYQNANLIQVASTSSGVPLYVQPAIGVTLSGPVTGTGNATTTPGGPAYAARHFQIAHMSYRIQYKGIRIGSREMPLWFDLQGTENVGTSQDQYGYMGSVNFGQVKKFGDYRLLYSFAYKEANAFISQFTDDDLGTGSGVNIKVHFIRFDLGLARFLEWQNLLFIQKEISGNRANFFVPLTHGAAQQYRFQSQLAIAFR